MTDMATFVIPQCDVLGLRAGKSYLAITANANQATVYGDDYMLYTIDRHHDERFTVIDMADDTERPNDADMANKYMREAEYMAEEASDLFEEVMDLEAVIIAMVKERYLGGD
jgi:hypothetical protein